MSLIWLFRGIIHVKNPVRGGFARGTDALGRRAWWRRYTNTRCVIWDGGIFSLPFFDWSGTGTSKWLIECLVQTTDFDSSYAWAIGELLGGGFCDICERLEIVSEWMQG